MTSVSAIAGQDMFISDPELDPTTLDSCGGVVIFEDNNSKLYLPPGEYAGAVGVLDVDGDHGGIDWEFFFELYDNPITTVIWSESVTAQPDSLELSHGPFTVPAGGALLAIIGIPEPGSPLGQTFGSGTGMTVTKT